MSPHDVHNIRPDRQRSETNRAADYPSRFGIRMQHVRWRR